MANIDDYNASIDAIKAIADAEVKYPGIPIEVYIQEAENLHHWCQDDKAALEAAGLNWEVADALPVRAGATREAQSIWNKERYTRQQAQQEWMEKSPEAYNLRDQLQHDFRFAFRKHSDLLGRVSEISDGSGDADMIQDLNDLSVLGKTNPEPLTLINFDGSRLDRAATLADEMAVILAAANGDKQRDSEAKTIRDRAYTYLKEVMDEVRQTGKYVFWQNHDRYIGYTSRYWKRKKTKSQPDEVVE